MYDAATPEEALEVWIGDEADIYVVLPLDGYGEIARASHWTLFAHLVEGISKVVVLATNVEPAPLPGRWTVAAFAACDAAEFDPSASLGYDIRIWSDDKGRVSTSRLLEMEDCDGGRTMRVEGRLFVRNPTGDAYEPAQLLTTYLADAKLPTSAEATPFREGERRLYYAADGSAAYVESPEAVERWPRVRGDEYLRTDCN